MTKKSASVTAIANAIRLERNSAVESSGASRSDRTHAW